MPALALPDLTVLVLAHGDTPQQQANARGHLFERFVATLLSRYGFEEPRPSNCNVTAEGIELDVVARHNLTRSRAIAECKAHSQPVKAKELTNFYGKLAADRLDDPGTFGLLVALPRLNPEGEEKARAIMARDSSFRYLRADDVVSAMRELEMVVDEPHGLGDTSDPAVVITDDGVFAATVLLDATSRNPTAIAVWAATAIVPQPTVELIRATSYGQGLPVIDVSVAAVSPDSVARPAATESQDEALIATVASAGSDFEYQLPASPRYFVGRKVLLSSLSTCIDSGEQVIVFNAKSGWGKSSLALKLGELAADRNGYALIVDTRTAATPRYIIQVLRRAVTEAAGDGLVSLPTDAAWGTLASALRTISRTTWKDKRRPLLVFFDQFENVFRDPEVTRAFRDLAVGVRDLSVPLIIGFAWKTDLVGWTESHPYQLRDEIRSIASVYAIEPFGPSEVSILLSRLEKRVGVRLAPDLKRRLREYSQGLPWLLKKLSDHVVRELLGGVTQEQLLAEALNVQSLFESDLRELNPTEHEVLRHIARYAPIAASEVTERYSPSVVQSLVNQRLIVQVGERLDTYWDIFRDFLNTGRVPVEESYILRQSPHQLARLLPLVVARGGDATVQELAGALNTTNIAIFNMSRELKLLGVSTQEPNHVRLVDEIWNADDRERALRRKVASALRRHRGLSAFAALSERLAQPVSIPAYADELPNVFPAVAVSQHTWSTYARALLSWMAYAGLIMQQGNDFVPAPEGYESTSVRLLDFRSPLRVRPAIPHEACGPVLDLIRAVANGEYIRLPADYHDRDIHRAAVAIGAVVVDPDLRLRMRRPELVQNGEINTSVLLELLEALPGGSAGLDVLRANPRATPREVGNAIREAAGTSWRDETVHSIGGYWRGWARAAGVPVVRFARN